LVDFMELHAHSEFSNLRLIDSNIKIENLIQEAYDKKLKGIAITDHEALGGHVRAIKKNKELMKEDKSFKVALGNEVYLVDSLDKHEKYWHFILIAKNKQGYDQIKKLSTEAWRNSFFDRGLERVIITYDYLEKVLKENKGNVIGSTACLGGYFPKLIFDYLENSSIENKRKIDNFLKKMKNIFNEDFYIELQPAISEEQKIFNEFALKLSKAYKIDYIITNDIHYIDKKDRKLHEAFLSSKEGDRELLDFYESTWMKTPEEILDRMKDHIEEKDIFKGIENTMKIYDKIEFFDLKEEMKIPKREVKNIKIQHIFKEYYQSFEYIEKFANSEYVQDRLLLSEIEKGFLEKNQEFNNINVGRINEELSHIWDISEDLKDRVSAYYNTMDKMIDIIWDEKGGNSIIGVARGSITGIYFAYLIDIIQLNPIEYNLPNWRHIHRSRPELPDIDIDTEASKRQIILKAMKENFGENNVLNVCTFKKEGSKSAILTSCRGLGISHDTAQLLADMIPIERGSAWTIRECIEGDGEEKKAMPEFKKTIEEYPNLKETALSIEGVVCGRSIHAAGIIIYNNGFLESNSLMKAPNGQFTTCWDLKDSEYTGNLKFDFLTVENLDKIRCTLDLLVDGGVIKDRGSLRDNYNNYLHPDKLEKTNAKMWGMLEKGEIGDLFQFSTDIGIQSAKYIKPKSLKEMAIANSVMRLAGQKGEEPPMERYVKFKNNIKLWYAEMKENGLNSDEINILKSHLKISYGVATEQEDVMEISMNPKITNFTIVEANKLRKSIAKKDSRLVEETKKIFIEKGRSCDSRDLFLKYIWEYQIVPQLGYSFSRNHTIPYSAIGLQNMNLVYKYGEIYWNTACLNVNAGAVDSDKDKNTDYGKIAKAIGEMQNKGINISLPDINKAQFSFYPDIEKNNIIFGLKGVNGIGDEVVSQIINNRPYSSLEDFINKNKNLNKTSVINLIKAGSFEDVENRDRYAIMRKYIKTITRIDCPEKEKLTMQNFNAILEMDILPNELKQYERIYKFRRYINKNKKENKKLDSFCEEFFKAKLEDKLIYNKDYSIDSDGVTIHSKNFEKSFKKIISPINNWIKKTSVLKLFNEKIFKDKYKYYWDKYCAGDLSKWEMDSISCYFSKHELEDVDIEKYNLSSFVDLPEVPIIYEEKEKYNKYVLYKIAGTILDKNKTRHTVSILTLDGVVNVKFYAGQFGYYDKQISKFSKKENKNKILEKSWFSRGNKIIVSGYRRGDQFVSKKYWNSIYQHSVVLIEDIEKNGDLILKYDREGQG